MNLTELSAAKKDQAARAIKEHYNVDIDFSKMDLSTTKSMLVKVHRLLKESRNSIDRHNSHKSPAYLKMLMMEKALTQHFNDIYKQPQIVLENEEVEKSQVILAAQDMVDSLQDMMEEISKMNVEELPAVVGGIESEIDAAQSQRFNEAVGGALTTLLGAIGEAKTAVQGALGSITGQETPTDTDFGNDLGEPELDQSADAELPELPELPEPEDEDEGEAGRGLR